MRRSVRLQELKTTYGAQSLSEAERAAQIGGMFDRIAPRYDLMNDMMSFGLHRYWKRVAVGWVQRQIAARPGAVLDLAGGTGDLALALARRSPDAQEIVIADASAGMLAQARARGGDRFRYVHAPAEELPLPDAAFSTVMLSFGLRNMTDPCAALAQVRRVLQPGGALILLEFSRPARWFEPLYNLHARHIIPRLGRWVAQDPAAYHYLIESIARFPAAEDLRQGLQDAGFEIRAERAFSFGIARLDLTGTKEARA